MTVTTKKRKPLKPTTIIVGCGEQYKTVRITNQRQLRFIAETRRAARADKRKFRKLGLI